MVILGPFYKPPDCMERNVHDWVRAEPPILFVKVVVNHLKIRL